MSQFKIEPLFGTLEQGQIAFTNSSLWMVITLALVWLFMLGGLKRELVPGRWQLAVESIANFIDGMLVDNIGQEGRKYVPYIFTIFIFILFANLLGLFPVGVVPGVHPFTVTSHILITGIMPMIPILFPIELVSFLVRPFSLALRLFIAMTAGHVLLKVFASFVIQGINAGPEFGLLVSLPSFALMIFVSVLEILICAIQAYVFALLSTLYINDAVNLH